MSRLPIVERVLVDTGPLVALLRRNDQHHPICSETLRTIRSPLLTCWPVLTEAAWLLRERPLALDALYNGAEAGVFELLELDRESLSHISALARKYRKMKPQLADLALIHLSEREAIDTIFTLDRRDFATIRLRGQRSVRLLPEAL